MKADIIASLTKGTNSDSHLLAPPPPPPPLCPAPVPLSSQISLFSQDDAPDVPEAVTIPTSNLAAAGPWQNGGRRQQARPSSAAAYSSAAAAKPVHSNTRQRRDRSKSQNRNPTIYIGSKVTSGEISFKGADRTVDRYIGSIDVDADNNEIKKFITDAGVKIIDFPRTHSSFKSFKISVRRSDLPTLEQDNFWPAGVVFRNFFRPRGQRVNRHVNGVDAAISATDGVPLRL